MLEQLFGSKTRVRLLMLMLNNPEKSYFLREIARTLGMQLNSIRREVGNLEKNGIIRSVAKAGGEKEKNKQQNKKYYSINTDSVIFAELKALFLKGQLLLEKKLIREIEKISQVYYLVLTGNFVGLEKGSTDLLLVGKVNRNEMHRIVRKFEKELNRQVNFTVMSLKEFRYRKDITDKFLYDILENKKIVIIDKLRCI
ncbi:hypothetical protein C4569_02380 [Candidatus Parcubacteria bacterium]|nr:MAG: hypothetical protein C4569_02380 [Candidatus Parcubacteria bacterium]